MAETNGGENPSRVAIVTGAASGIGLAIARKLAQKSHRVALFDLNSEAAQKAAAELAADGLRAVAYQVDVADPDSVEVAVRLVRKDFGPVQIVVTSAGIEEYTAFEEITREQWNRLVAVNLTGTSPAFRRRCRI